MSEKLVLLAGAAALAALGASPVEAAPNPAQSLEVNSFVELLQPIPNAREKLAEIDSQPRAVGNIELAEYYYHHHHHHHHHHWRRPPWRWHHHHHHHHHHYYW